MHKVHSHTYAWPLCPHLMSPCAYWANWENWGRTGWYPHLGAPCSAGPGGVQGLRGLCLILLVLA